MNKIYIICLLLITTVFTCSFSFYDLFGFGDDEVPPESKIISRVLSQTLLEIRKKEPFTMMGIGEQEKDGKRNGIFVSLELRKVLTKEQCQKLAVELTEIYLKNINEDKELRQYLYNIPFTIYNFELKIFLTKPNRDEIPPPDIRIVSTMKGEIVYKSQDPNSKYGYIITEDPYEEVKKLVYGQQENQTPTKVE